MFVINFILGIYYKLIIRVLHFGALDFIRVYAFTFTFMLIRYFIISTIISAAYPSNIFLSCDFSLAALHHFYF